MFTPDPARYDGRMPYRKCGRWGLKLPAFSLGFWHNFGDDDNLEEGRRIMHRAFEAGITHFDFANNYGPPYGAAERNCGQILAEDFAPYRDELIISTKAGHDMFYMRPSRYFPNSTPTKTCLGCHIIRTAACILSAYI